MKKVTLFISTIMLGAAAMAQIPNANFQMWADSPGYKVPVGWANLDSATSITSVYTCTQDSPSHSGMAGTYYLNLTSKTIGTFVAPGVAVSGKINYSTAQPQSGFANTTRPVSLNGYWQYMPSTGDTGHVAILLSKWNDTAMMGMGMRDTVAFTNYTLTGMAMSWAAFTVNLNYHTGEVPDSAIILLSASGTMPMNGSYLYVDSLYFNGSVPASVPTVNGIANKVSVYPNPASGLAYLAYNSSMGEMITVDVMDITGRRLKQMSYSATIGDNILPLFSVGELSKGLYIIKVTGDGYADVLKFVAE